MCVFWKLEVGMFRGELDSIFVRLHGDPSLKCTQDFEVALGLSEIST